MTILRDRADSLPATKAAAYPSPLEHLHDWSVMVALFVKRFIVLHGDRLVGADGRIDDLLVSTNEALGFFARRLRDLPIAAASADRERTLDSLDAHIVRLREDVRRREAATEASGARLPLRDLVARFALDAHAELVVAAVAVIEMDVGLARVCRYAMADARSSRLTVGFIHELLAPTGALHDALWSVWSAEGPLRRFGLITVGPNEAATVPLFERPLALWTRLATFLRGETTELDERLARCAHISMDTTPMRDLVLSTSVVDGLGRLASRRARFAGPRLTLWGPRGVGKRSIAVAMGRSVGARTIIIDAAALRREVSPALVGLALTEARLTDAPLFIDLSDVSGDEVTWWQEVLRVHRDLLELHPTPIVFASQRPAPWLFDSIAELVELRVDIPESARLGELWHAGLGELVEELGVDPGQIAATYRLPPGRIVRAVREIRQQVQWDDMATRSARHDIVWTAARRQLTHRLGSLAEPIATGLTLADVVLPPKIHERMLEILTYARQQTTVFETWGFGLRMTYGRGLGILFSGPPGTGKTFVSSILARELGREMFRVDTSRVVDKYIGETEKNLARIFDEAERAQAVLLFDEADSLFAKRTNVESSNDRYANQNVNYLLQRMEDYSGLSILTTNLEASIDEAFRRRLRFSVRFPEPSIDERAMLWRSLIPLQASAHVAEDINFRRLAARFEITGGYIKNAVLRAAMVAADQQALLSEDHLDEAATAVCEELGRLVRPR